MTEDLEPVPRFARPLLGLSRASRTKELGDESWQVPSASCLLRGQLGVQRQTQPSYCNHRHICSLTRWPLLPRRCSWPQKNVLEITGELCRHPPAQPPRRPATPDPERASCHRLMCVHTDPRSHRTLSERPGGSRHSQRGSAGTHPP